MISSTSMICSTGSGMFISSLYLTSLCERKVDSYDIFYTKVTAFSCSICS